MTIQVCFGVMFFKFADSREIKVQEKNKCSRLKSTSQHICALAHTVKLYTEEAMKSDRYLFIIPLKFLNHKRAIKSLDLSCKMF